MSTNQVRFERRAAQRFDFHLPTTIRITATGQEAAGFTQDLSGRGVFLFTDLALVDGLAVELTLVMPGEITLGESMRVRCRGRVVRVVQLDATGKLGAAVQLEGYEYLPAEPLAAAAGSSSLHESREQDAGVSMHTFEWRGPTPAAQR
jgi:PilZ domain